MGILKLINKTALKIGTIKVIETAISVIYYFLKKIVLF